MNTTAQPLRRGATPEETRRRIEDTAEALFRSMGYQKTAVADIARELGMSPANIYRFYASKSAINEAIAARMLTGVEGDIWTIARGREPASERLRLLLRTLHQRHMALFFSERRLHDMVTAAMSEHWGVVERFIHSIQTAIRHVLMDGLASGEFGGIEAERTAESIKQATLPFTHPGLIAECMANIKSDTELAQDLEAMVDLLLRALRP
ncbi:TetR/AcrR family transcriptional regulator [Roseomonas stagni]|uniref:TetR/AcrR family transcriptional regulator n=1 Tax=Falsiroseomonas algicola TaxID=2716930 RepID=A0A6M1LP55_9PROT|nr:TetR family transcriptional regulator [Falsiroseomonas algicola]NGM22146.1 TetR/AcrR family transcriptional regulator [Falsiroseomonas algicola]